MRKIIILFLCSAMFGCGLKEENEQLKQQLTDMEQELVVSREAAESLQGVGALLDSIDAERDVLTLDLEKGTSYEDYQERVRKLNKYLEDSDRKLAETEEMLAKLNANNSAFANTIGRLRSQLKAKNTEITELNTQVEKYKTENNALIKTVDIQSKEIQAQEEEIKKKKEELALLENRLEQLMITAKKTEADAYYAQAQALEEAARRTKLAPKKKKNTYKEALELYKKSFEMGNKDAYKKVEELEEKVN